MKDFNQNTAAPEKQSPSRWSGNGRVQVQS